MSSISSSIFGLSSKDDSNIESDLFDALTTKPDPLQYIAQCLNKLKNIPQSQSKE